MYIVFCYRLADDLDLPNENNALLLLQFINMNDQLYISEKVAPILLCLKFFEKKNSFDLYRVKKCQCSNFDLFIIDNLQCNFIDFAIFTSCSNFVIRMIESDIIRTTVRLYFRHLFLIPD